MMLSRSQKDLESEARGIRCNRDKTLPCYRHSLAGILFLLEDVAKKTALLIVIVFLCRIQFFRQSQRGHRCGNELGVGMRHCRPRRGSLVVKNQDVAQAHVAVKINQAFAVRPDHFLDLIHRGVSHAEIVLWSFDDYFMRADSVHPGVHSHGLPIQLPLDLERREFIRNDSDAPAGLVGTASASANRHDLRGSLVLVPFTESTKSAGGLFLVAAEIIGTAAALGGDDHPALLDRIVAQFWHSFKRGKVKDGSYPLPYGRRCFGARPDWPDSLQDSIDARYPIMTLLWC